MNIPLRVLIVEDNPDDAELMVMCLEEEGFRVDWQRVQHETDYLTALEIPPDLILSDWSLPQFSGLRALHLFRERGLDVPFIIVSGHIGEEAAISALRQGAYDYVLKDRAKRLGKAVEHALEDKRLQKEKKKVEDDLRKSEARFRRLAENAQDIIFRYQLLPERRIDYVSPAVTVITGSTPEEYYADPELALNLVVQDDLVFLEKGTQGEAPLDRPLTLRNIRRNGALVWLEYRFVPVYDEQGNLAAVEGIARDITGRVRSEAMLQQRLAELESLYTISVALRSTITLEGMLSSLLNEILSVLHTNGGAVWLYQPESDELRLSFARGVFVLDQEIRLKPGEGIAGTVFVSGQAHLSPDFANDPLARPLPGLPTSPGWEGAWLPIRTASETVGVLVVSVQQPRHLTPEELKLLSSLTELAGAAIHRIRLHEETVHRLAQLESLRTIDQAITASQNLRLTLDIILEEVMTQLDPDAAGVFLLHPHLKVLEYAAGRGFRTEAFRQIQFHLGEAAIGKAALERRTVMVSDAEEGVDEQSSRLLQGEQFTSCIIIPLMSKGEVKGVLGIFHRRPRHLDADWLHFLETLAGQAAIAVDNASLFENLQRANLDLVLAYDATIEGWSYALDLRDEETEGHSRRVAEMTLRIARELAISEKELPHIKRGALLHDIGKMGIPDAILLKPGKLTEEEWELMRRHPRYAFDMLSPIDYLRPALDIPYCHHEKWDGTGYPRGLKSDEIPIGARIFAVVDVHDALTSDRPYRKAWTQEKAIEHIHQESGKHFDPQVVEAFLRLASAQETP